MTNLEKYRQLLRSFDDKIDSLHLQTYEELQSYRRTIIKELIQLYKKTLNSHLNETEKSQKMQKIKFELSTIIKDKEYGLRGTIKVGEKYIHVRDYEEHLSRICLIQNNQEIPHPKTLTNVNQLDFDKIQAIYLNNSNES